MSRTDGDYGLSDRLGQRREYWTEWLLLGPTDDINILSSSYLSLISQYTEGHSHSHWSLSNNSSCQLTWNKRILVIDWRCEGPWSNISFQKEFEIIISYSSAGHLWAFINIKDIWERFPGGAGRGWRQSQGNDKHLWEFHSPDDFLTEVWLFPREIQSRKEKSSSVKLLQLAASRIVNKTFLSSEVQARCWAVSGISGELAAIS